MNFVKSWMLHPSLIDWIPASMSPFPPWLYPRNSVLISNLQKKKKKKYWIKFFCFLKKKKKKKETLKESREVQTDDSITGFDAEIDGKKEIEEGEEEKSSEGRVEEENEDEEEEEEDEEEEEKGRVPFF